MTASYSDRRIPLTIYILCYNRPDFARESIQSVLAQTNQKFKLIISDHSSNDEVMDMVRNNFSDIRYIRRPKELKHLEHFNICIDEVETEYYCLFHDDDIMDPLFVHSMIECIRAYPDTAAYACNSYIETSGKVEPRLSFLSKRRYEAIDSPRNLAERYFSRNQSGIAPNPSYVYSRRLAGDQRFIVDGGKYADVSLLLDILLQGPIIWLNVPLMTYRMHGNNLGSVESLPDRLRFLGYLKKHRQIFGEDLLLDYRCSFIYKKILKNGKYLSSKRYRLAKKLLSTYGFERYTRFSTYRVLIIRLLNKWGSI